MSFTDRLVDEVNSFRRNHCGYTDKLKKNKAYFKGDNIWRHPKCAIETIEGAKAFDDAIEYLRRETTSSAHELTKSKGLNQIAQDFLKEFQKNPQADVPLKPVIEKYGSFTGNFRRFIQFGGFSPEVVVINLIVGDGDPKRENRETLLLPDLEKIGVAYGPHETMRHCSVIVVATKFNNKFDPNDKA